MTALVIGTGVPATGLVESLRAAGVDAQLDVPPDEAAEAGEIAALAAELVRLEGSLAGSRPAAVLLADAGDSSLAGTLVATKLLIPVGAVGIDAWDGQNAGLLAQLADRKLSADAADIVAWIEALPTLPEGFE
jgi:hypothetical protein